MGRTIEYNNAFITMENGLVKKELKYRWHNRADPDKWLETYDKFYTMYGNIPKVHSWIGNTIIMDQAPGKILRELSQEVVRKDYHLIMRDVWGLVSNTFDFKEHSYIDSNINPTTANNERWFVHCDMSMYNFMWDTESKCLTLVDVESWSDTHVQFYHMINKVNTTMNQLLNTREGYYWS